VIEVRVPCSTSNLGAGFDCLGLAFSRYLTVQYHAGDAPLHIERAGTLTSLTHDAADDAVVIAMRATSSQGQSAGGVLVMHSDIPIGRGLGSSAAATVAGIVIGHLLSMQQPDTAQAVVCDIKPSLRMEALALATDIEGHPDNAAPSLFGGLVAVARDATGTLNALQLPLSGDIGFVFAAPDVAVSTAAARAALPADVPHAAATRMLGRVAALVKGLETGDADLLRIGMLDELHVQYRLPLIPGGAAAIEAVPRAGGWAATISGSGSGIIAVAPQSSRSSVASAMSEALAREDAGARATGIELEPDMLGVQARWRADASADFAWD
jgi:homoserine kinase